MTKIGENLYLTLKELECMADIVSHYDKKVSKEIRNNYNYLRFIKHYHELTCIHFNKIHEDTFSGKIPEQLELAFE